jgi:hypothetical protein
MTEAEVRSESTAWTTLNAVEADPLSIIQMQPVTEPLLSPFTPPESEPVLIVKRPPKPARLGVALRDDAVVSIRGETVWVDDFELIRRWLSLRVQIFTDAYGPPADDSVKVNAITLAQLRGLKPEQEYVTTRWESGPATMTLGLVAHDDGGKRSFSGLATCVDLAKLPGSR